MLITGRIHRMGVALLRIVVGIIFFWAGTDKFLTNFSAAGFLGHATGGSLGWPFVTGTPDPKAIYNPTHDFWVSLSQNAGAMSVVNVLVVAGEIGIGIALILGLATRFAAIMGALMMLLFFFAAWSFSNGIVNEHLTYLVVCLAIAGLGAGKYYGLDGWAAGVSFARTSHWFRTYFLSGEPTGQVTV